MENKQSGSVSRMGTRPKYRYRPAPGRSRLCLWAHARLMRANVATNIGEKAEAARLRAGLVDFLFANSLPI